MSTAQGGKTASAIAEDNRMATRSELLDLLPRVDPYMADAIREELAGPLPGDPALYWGMLKEKPGKLDKITWVNGTVEAMSMVTNDGELFVSGEHRHWELEPSGVWVIRWSVATTLRRIR